MQLLCVCVWVCVGCVLGKMAELWWQRPPEAHSWQTVRRLFISGFAARVTVKHRTQCRESQKCVISRGLCPVRYGRVVKCNVCAWCLFSFAICLRCSTYFSMIIIKKDMCIRVGKAVESSVTEMRLQEQKKWIVLQKNILSISGWNGDKKQKGCKLSKLLPWQHSTWQPCVILRIRSKAETKLFHLYYYSLSILQKLKTSTSTEHVGVVVLAEIYFTVSTNASVCKGTGTQKIHTVG